MSDMNSEFWGLVLVPGKKFSPEEPMPIRVTQICFGEKVVKDSRTCVFIRNEGKDYALCTLLEGKTETLTVDIRFPDDNEFSLHISGPNEVHLTGEVLASSFDSDDDEDEAGYLTQLYGNGELEDNEEDSDESDLEPADVEELEPEEVTKVITEIKKTVVNGHDNQNKKRKNETKEAPVPENKRPKENGKSEKSASVEVTKKVEITAATSEPQKTNGTEPMTNGSPKKLTKSQKKKLRQQQEAAKSA